MNAINRIGQKIICVRKPHEFIVLCSAIWTTPEFGKIYLVGAFEDVTKDIPGIHLRDFESPFCGCRGRRLPWSITCFRPVTESDKKSEAVTEMMDNIRKSAPAPKEKVPS